MKRPDLVFYIISMLLIVAIGGTIFIVVFAGFIR